MTVRTGIVVLDRRHPAGVEQGTCEMSDSNQITVRGRVGTDPDVLVTGNDRQMTKFRLGSTRGYRDTATGEWRETGTEWFTVKTWGAGGAAVIQSIRRGMPVIVQGFLSSEEWDSGERRHHTNVITATAIGVDVKYGLVTYAKVLRRAPAEADPAGTGQGGHGQARRETGLAEADAPDEDGLEPEEDAGGSDAVADPQLAPDPVDPRSWEKVVTT
ncbi:single-stranded DNA-binding protein [Georgenia sp. H159]|uniref:single-stranded DNA-binding protein n=1 Tax=Georgenia sp. H159 TaxID=3076115 RepID=UPI002D78167C|nr:single-stranded DNA-binding protein [Georgenia sp. H159]